MKAKMFVACINVLSLFLSYILLFYILRKTTMKWRYIYLGVLLFGSIFRSVYIALDLDWSKIKIKATYKVDLTCTVKAVLTITSHYVRIVGLPLFVFATFLIILRNYSVIKINRLYFWALVTFISFVFFINTYYILRNRIQKKIGFCYLDWKGLISIANMNIATTILSITAILGLSVIIYKKKRITPNIKYLVLASIYYSAIPLITFFQYFMYLMNIDKGHHLRAYQRISTFLIFLGVLFFERKTSQKKKEILLKWLLGFKSLRDVYKSWLDKNNFRKDFMAVELYEKLEEHEGQIEKINIEDYQRLFVESVVLENDLDVSKLKSELTESLEGKYAMFIKSSEYEQVQKIHENTLDSDMALLEN